MSPKVYYVYRAPKGRKLVENGKCKSFATVIKQFYNKNIRTIPCATPMFPYNTVTVTKPVLVQCHLSNATTLEQGNITTMEQHYVSGFKE
jgi:hypothetical protein